MYEQAQAIRAQREVTIAEIARKAVEKALDRQRGKKAAEPKIQIQWGSEEQSALNIKLENLKIKTRGIATKHTGEHCTTTDEHLEPKQERVTMAVTKRALSVFNSMFPGRDIEDRCKNVEWD